MPEGFALGAHSNLLWAPDGSALLVTSDDHFEGLPGVEYIPRPEPATAAEEAAPPPANP